MHWHPWFILISLAMLTTIIGCQPASPSPAPAPTPVTQTQPNTPQQTPQPTPTPEPTALPTPPSQTPPSQQGDLLVASVTLDDGQPVIPTGIILNLKYSVNRSANLTMSCTLPDGSVITYFKQTAIPGSYVYPIRIEKPVGEKIITLTAVGTDGQIVKATHKYWAGSELGNTELP